MSQPQAVGPREVFHGAHSIDWHSEDAIYVLGPDHKTRRWRRSSAGFYRLIEEMA